MRAPGGLGCDTRSCHGDRRLGGWTHRRPFARIQPRCAVATATPECDSPSRLAHLLTGLTPGPLAAWRPQLFPWFILSPVNLAARSRNDNKCPPARLLCMLEQGCYVMCCFVPAETSWERTF
ncbi:hypothetical protein AAFF_G00279040 [Aldrovandia affinis]|uniref:Uncharacterized protein n=1 Tax=Aldrovandia affinis TaxID=143900 RepID=A0AAD7SRA7_9TELE|nr:hypothetical protein AAFF_G00279040 [Aldrovandia affinis]